MSGDMNAYPDTPTANITPNYSFSTINIDSILSSREFFTAKENYDRDTLRALANIPTETLYPRLVEWATHGFQGGFTLTSITLVPPNFCSDGIIRTFQEYIDFIAGEGGHMTIISQLQSRFQDITISTSYENNNIHILLTKQ